MHSRAGGLLRSGWLCVHRMWQYVCVYMCVHSCACSLLRVSLAGVPVHPQVPGHGWAQARHVPVQPRLAEAEAGVG